MQKLRRSRRELFEELDRPALQPLPADRYEIGRWKSCRVNIDYHVEVEHNYYSVPSTLLRQSVEARFTDSTVEIFHRHTRVASHRRLSGRGRHSTFPEHMPLAHRTHSEWSPSRILAWANQAGPAKQNLIVTGPTGTGKTYLPCALAEKACRSDFSAYYVRGPRLLHDLVVARADGSYTRLLAKLARIDLLAIDDWLLTPFKENERRDLLEIIEDRYERGSTLIATQLPTTGWHQAIGEPTVADAICDRLLHRAHRIDLRGPSLRKKAIEPVTQTVGSEDPEPEATPQEAGGRKKR